ncbi:MAG: SpoIIE family protein phosphatase [Flavobacteriales bacterium]|nr:SpoIIE family protein phosphatase [Flavobacteriales bacterium]
MKVAEIKDSIIDELLIESKNNVSYLVPLLARFAGVCATSNQNQIKHYTGLISQVCLIWETEHPEVEGIRMLNEGMANYYLARFKAVIEPCRKALCILENSTYTDLYGVGLMVYGAAHRSLGELDTAVEYLLKGTENISLASELAIYHCYCFYQLAEINVHIKDFETAEKNYNRAIEISEDLNLTSGLFRAYNGIANLYLATKDLEKCKQYLDLSLSISNLSSAEKGRSYCDLGIYYFEKGDCQNSETTLRKSYQLRIDSSLRDAASTSLLNLAKTQLASGQVNEALVSLEEALEICLEFQSKSKMLLCYHLLAKTYDKLGEWEKSTIAFKEYDELQNELTTKQLQNIYKLKNEQIEKQKALVEKAHREITDSIAYAKRIQSAILPPNRIVKDYLNNSFVLYKPKDVVAGDFYWMHKSNNKVLFAAADCTGHGVPGALVSVVCNNALNRSVREYSLTDPAKILDKTREIVIEEFDKSDEEVKDGMDIALCSIDGFTLSYAGANNPLWIVINGEVLETKADKQPIGKYATNQPFTSHQFDLQKGDTIYLFSDGYPDQFGGPKGKKYKSRNFKSFLISIQNESMDKQHDLLLKEFESWKGNLEQIDDVCVIGVRV